MTFADESVVSQLRPPSVFDRAGHLLAYLNGRDSAGLLALLRSEAEDDPAALLLAVALLLPAYLAKPPSLGLVLAVLAVRRVRR